MPTVPTYDNLQTQVDPGNWRTSRFEAPSGPLPGEIAGRQMTAFGDATQGLGGKLGQIASDMADQANQTRITDAVSQMTAARLKLTYDPNEGYVHKRGQAALPDKDGTLDQKYGASFKTQIDQIASSLSNPIQKQKFAEAAASQASQFQAGIDSHVAKEFQDHSLAVQDTAVKTYQDQMGLAWGDAQALADAHDGIYVEAVRKAKLLGLTGAETEAYAHQELSTGHAATIMGMLQAQQPEQARAYLADAVKANEITAKDKYTLTAHVNAVGSAVEGEKGADDIWNKNAPKDVNDSVRIYDMEAVAREQFKGRPEVLHAAIDGIRQRAAAFNGQQSEVNAKNVNSVYSQIDSGVPLSRAMSSPAGLALSGVERDKILAQQESRAATRASRAASEESRALTSLVRQDKLLLMHNADKFLDFSTADNLASIKTADEITAQRSTFGFEATQELLKKWELVQNRDGKLTARLDDNTFRSVAHDVLDIDPYATGLSADQKAELGRVRTQVDIGLGRLAAAKRAPLTLDEKTDYMRKELAKTVEVNGFLWNSTKPAAALSRDEAQRVVVPTEKRADYAKELRKAFDASGGNPRYAPTEENLRRYHLQKTSPIAVLPDATK